DVSLVDDVQHGTLSLNADGSFTYTATDGFIGTDSFTYNVTDGTNNDEATVTINIVNHAPVFDSPTYSAMRFDHWTGPVLTVLAQDGDPTDQVRYSLLNNSGGAFSIDEQTGEIRIIQALNYDEPT